MLKFRFEVLVGPVLVMTVKRFRYDNDNVLTGCFTCAPTESCKPILSTTIDYSHTQIINSYWIIVVV